MFNINGFTFKTDSFDSFLKSYKSNLPEIKKLDYASIFSIFINCSLYCIKTFDSPLYYKETTWISKLSLLYIIKTLSENINVIADPVRFLKFEICTLETYNFSGYSKNFVDLTIIEKMFGAINTSVYTESVSGIKFSAFYYQNLIDDELELNMLDISM